MERESNQMQPMCRSGCGFFGNPATEGLCSKCFKESLKKKQQPSPTTSSSTTTYQSSGNTPSSPYLSSTPAPTTPIPCALPQRIPVVRAEDFIREVNLESEEIRMMRIWEYDGWMPEHVSEEEVSGGEGAARASNLIDLTPSHVTDGDEEPGKEVAVALPVQTPKKKRCLTCRKKLGLTGFECRCGGLYCATHRYSDKHECSFNYRELGAEEIRRNNPVVIGEKIQKF